MNNITVSAFITAPGESLRMGTEQNKNFLLLSRQPVLSYSINACIRHPLIGEIIIVHKTGEGSFVQTILAENCEATEKPIHLIMGGQTRQQSAYRGICAADTDSGYVLIHDAARPFLTASLIERTVQAAVSYGAACAAVPSKDTPALGKNNFISATVRREDLFLIQTPQVFPLPVIRQAHELRKQIILRQRMIPHWCTALENRLP
jgi:2-C-methyl-D-erythritol 4-phosphate cytidylyltransferase